MSEKICNGKDAVNENTVDENAIDEETNCKKTLISSLENLVSIKENYTDNIGRYKYRVLVCSGAGCISSDCHAVKEALVKSLQENNISNEMLVTETGCIGTCDLGPVMLVMPEGVFYTKLDPSLIPDIVTSHFLNGKIKVNNTYYDRKRDEYIPYIKDIGYFKEQVKIALRNCGNISFSSMEEYIANDGYLALAKVLGEMCPEDVINEIKKSGLRGRGGGGFPTWIKLQAGMKTESSIKYIVCNADEGDPGAFM
ncbi:MAG TPA: hydrogenase, partial [Clostridiaceae bacterium]|nr:hydrogenase [Clostridiaceae bacterium]